MLGKNFAPLAEKLNNVEWGEFKFKKFFTCLTVRKKLSKLKIDNSSEYPVYSAETSNNGIVGYVNEPEFICNEKNPIYINFGDHTRNFNIATKSFSVLDNVKVLLPKINNIRILQFIISSWKKQIPNLGYSRHWKLAQECFIPLPTKDGEIDFEFMEKFITKLEAERITELDAYLTAAGLKDFILTDEEEFVLENLNSCIWKKFLLKDLFEKLNLKFKRKNFDKRYDVSQEPTEEFSLPLVNAKDGNNGIMFYGREEDWEFAEMTIDIVSNGAVATGNVYLQPQKTGVMWDAYLIKPKFTPSVELLNFFATIIYKTIKPKYAYEFKATWNRVSEEKIYLPTKDGEIDYEFMEKFITAVQKIIIADVVKYSEEKISAYRQAANK